MLEPPYWSFSLSKNKEEPYEPLDDNDRYRVITVSKLLPEVLKVAVPDPAGVTLYHTDLQTLVCLGSELSNVA